MATLELGPDEEYLIGGVRVYAEWDQDECHTFVTLDGWKKREFDLYLKDDAHGAVEFLEYERQAPPEENRAALHAIRGLILIKKPEASGFELEDPDGNLI